MKDTFILWEVEGWNSNSGYSDEKVKNPPVSFAGAYFSPYKLVNQCGLVLKRENSSVMLLQKTDTRDLLVKENLWPQSPTCI